MSLASRLALRAAPSTDVAELLESFRAPTAPTAAGAPASVALPGARRRSPRPAVALGEAVELAPGQRRLAPDGEEVVVTGRHEIPSGAGPERELAEIEREGRTSTWAYVRDVQRWRLA